MVGPGVKEWDFDTQMHKRGQIRVYNRLMYQDGNQFQGMNPTKPGMFVQKPVMVKKDTLRRWAWKHVVGKPPCCGSLIHKQPSPSAFRIGGS